MSLEEKPDIFIDNAITCSGLVSHITPSVCVNVIAMKKRDLPQTQLFVVYNSRNCIDAGSPPTGILYLMALIMNMDCIEPG